MPSLSMTLCEYFVSSVHFGCNMHALSLFFFFFGYHLYRCILLAQAAMNKLAQQIQKERC